MHLGKSENVRHKLNGYNGSSAVSNHSNNSCRMATKPPINNH